ncbi:MAG: aspartyl/asparaginyl beta-hydroxylase domain-containing protein [Hyphomonadaceae bacterium]|nr:aspartyl/asparaginyl beta-hydroxylase domain-containing protein [Hyphomonadaceae bacterium]
MDSDALASLARAEDALGRNDFAAARAMFLQLAEHQPRNLQVLLGMARACRGLQDYAGMSTYVDAALNAEPGHVLAMVLKADQLVGAGDMRGAGAMYAAAVRRAPASPTAREASELKRAAAEAQKLARAYSSFLQTEIERAVPGALAERVERALSLMLGKTRIYQQQPRFFYFPELPQIQFYEPDQFDWAPGLEAATAAIRSELLALADDAALFTPYLQRDVSRPQGGNAHGGLVGNPAWSACYLIRNGAVVPEVAERCPNTLAALARVPLADCPARSPSVLFSRLLPGTRIPPHHGFVNTRLIGHLPLVAPPGCALRVGNDTREWKEGKLLVFDDTIEHEAWNLSDSVRTVLLFDFWRPELSPIERDQVRAIFHAIDAYNGKSLDWD